MTSKEFTQSLKSDFKALVDKYEGLYTDMKEKGVPTPAYSLYIGVRLRPLTVRGKIYSSGLTLKDQFADIDNLEKPLLKL